jgi:SHS2 domain-containing protein
LTTAGFTILEHTADVGFEARGDTAAGLFEQAVAALVSIAVDDTNLTTGARWPIAVTGPDYASLLVNFLEEVLYLFDTGHFAARSCEVTQIDETHVSAALVGEPRQLGRHPWKLIVKAVTYHDLEVTERDGTWVGRVFLDV